MEAVITIGMPVFNDVDYIEDSILSVLKQSEPRFVLIISDDGSSDGSADICKQYAEKDERIQYIRQPKNLGISKNMEFLVQQAKTPFFMWAGDDDLIQEKFVEKHIQALKSNKNAIVSFGKYQLIDGAGKCFEVIDNDYGSFSRFLQLLILIFKPNDGFGYGVFKTNKIKTVRFPIWWWPNKKTPYNNIYPSLCYYLNRGKYLHQEEILFSKRVKTGNKINHIISGEGNGIKELINYYIRRFYLINYTTIQVLKSNTFWNALIIYPFLFVKWFLLDCLIITFSSIESKFKK